MAEDLMRYDLMAQEALRGVMRAALLQVAKSGLPGDHHFYIAFSTTLPGVRVSERLLSRYPEEMTIVLQHQFWGLDITDTNFSIELSFDNIPEKLVVPFSAVKGFFDPAVQFGLQFDNAQANQNDEPEVAPLLSETGSAGAQAAHSADLNYPLDQPIGPETVAVADNSNVVKLDNFRRNQP